MTLKYEILTMLHERHGKEFRNKTECTAALFQNDIKKATEAIHMLSELINDGYIAENFRLTKTGRAFLMELERREEERIISQKESSKARKFSLIGIIISSVSAIASIAAAIAAILSLLK